MQHKHNPGLTGNARALRKSMTKEESHLWYDFLKSHPMRFLRQKVIDSYIADFYCAQAKLVIELDGSQHYEEKGMLRDRIRTRRIEAYGLTVIRIPNKEVMRNFQGVREYIEEFVRGTLRC
jgi:very-short-patch-repair endonuclease